MKDLLISLLVFALIFGGALAGMVVRPLLSDHHLHADSKDVVRLTAGLIGWLLRSGALLSALLSILPLWQEFDPLMVVRHPRRRDAKQPPPTNVDRMFDDAQGLKYEGLKYEGLPSDRRGPA